MLVMIFSLIFCVIAQEISWSVHHESVKEGVELYVHTIPDTKMVSVLFRYRIHQQPQNGMVHFAEHLMFLYKKEGLYYDQWLEDIGATSQGSTDLSSMKLMVHLPIESWEDWVLLEKERRSYRCTNWEEQRFEAQRSVVLHESLQFFDSEARVHGQELRQAIFGRSALGRSVLGSTENILRWDMEIMCSYIQKDVLNAEVEVIVVGDISKEKAALGAREIFSSHRPAQKIKEREFAPRTLEKIAVGDEESLYVMWPLPSQDHPDGPLLQLWMEMLTDTRFGALQTETIRARGWIEYGVQGGYGMLQLKGDTLEQRTSHLHATLYGWSGWWMLRAHRSRAVSIYNRSRVHRWDTQEGRLMWVEHCVRSNNLNRCFEQIDIPSYRELTHVRNLWLSWDRASVYRIVSP